jgi:hypothetical protein
MPKTFASKAQARTMRAIAHGWKPSGKVADIPVKVAKEATAENKGKAQPKREHVAPAPAYRGSGANHTGPMSHNTGPSGGGIKGRKWHY